MSSVSLRIEKINSPLSLHFYILKNFVTLETVVNALINAFLPSTYYLILILLKKRVV